MSAEPIVPAQPLLLGLYRSSVEILSGDQKVTNSFCSTAPSRAEGCTTPGSATKTNLQDRNLQAKLRSYYALSNAVAKFFQNPDEL